MNKVNAIAYGGKKNPDHGERRWVEVKRLVAKSILEWLLINTVVRNLFSSPSETHQICKFTVTTLKY